MQLEATILYNHLSRVFGPKVGGNGISEEDFNEIINKKVENCNDLGEKEMKEFCIAAIASMKTFSAIQSVAFQKWILDERYVWDRSKEKYIAAWDNYSEHNVSDLYIRFIKKPEGEDKEKEIELMAWNVKRECWSPSFFTKWLFENFNISKK